MTDPTPHDPVDLDERRYDGGGGYTPAEEAAIEAEDDARAEEMIGDAGGLRGLEFGYEWTHDIHTDMARAFRNLAGAFAELRQLELALQRDKPCFTLHGLIAVLQAVLAMRNRAKDAALLEVENDRENAR